MESSPISNSPSGDAAATPGPSRSIVSMMIGVFTSPVQAFDDFCKRPSILIPLITVMILAALAGALTVTQTSMVQYDMMKNSTVLPPAAIEQMRQEAVNAEWYAGTYGPIIGVLLGSLFGALLAWVLGKFIFGGQAKFTAVWAIGIMGALISTAGGLLKVPLVLAKDTANVSIGLAALMPGRDFTSILYSLLMAMDFFVIWGVIVTGIGYAAIFGLSRGKGMMVAIIPTVLMVCLMIGLMVVGMSFAGVDITFM